MRLSPFQIADLLARHLQNKLSVQEEILLQEQLQENEEYSHMLEAYRDTPAVQKELNYIADLNLTSAWEKTKEKKRKTGFSMRRSFKLFLKVASIIIILSGLVWHYTVPKDTGIVDDNTRKYKNDVLPGNYKAELHLSNGRVVKFNEESNLVKEINGITILGHDGELSYKADLGDQQIELVYNTLKVPASGTYRLILPDGSKVRLNAVSELRFPIDFGPDNRIVYLKGEAYFEVKKDAKKPFLVEAEGSVIEVIGTHFNINAYERKNTTTLFEGSVKMRHQGKEVLLKPGQEAYIENNNISLGLADLQKAIAWKENNFYFKDDDINHIMMQVLRWYDLQVSYHGKMPLTTYTGSIKRDAKLSEVVEMLSFISGATFTIDGRKLDVHFNQ